MIYPKAYVLQHHKHGTYVRPSNPSYCVEPNVLTHYEDDKEWGAFFFKNEIEDAKMWTNLKKVKRFLKKDIAKYFIVVGSDQTVIPATDLFQ